MRNHVRKEGAEKKEGGERERERQREWSRVSVRELQREKKERER